MEWLLNSKPYDVQTAAGDAANGMPGFCYFMEMGLGKSSTLLNEYVNLINAGKIDHLLIHCPNSLKRNWKDEIEKWGVTARVYLWPQKPKFKVKDGKCTYKTDESIIWIFNYESVLFSGGEEVYNFITSNRVMWTLDESSRIKNFNAKTTKTILGMSTYATYRRNLTGTPMNESVMDLWSQLRFVGEIPGWNPYAFRNHFGVMGGYMGKDVIGAKNVEELDEILKKCAFQAKKKDWTDLPEKIYTTRHIEMTKPQQDAYNDMKRHFVLMLNDSTTITAPMIITQLDKLQQISRGFIYDEDRETQVLVEPSRNPCIDMVKEILEQIEGKLVVAVKYRYSMQALYGELYHYDVARLQGGMTDDEIATEKKKFNDSESCRVIVNQIGVGGIGHTLIGGKTDKTRCSTEFFYENTYSREKRKQFEDRIHRYGQEADSCVYIDGIASPVDNCTIMALQAKDDLVKMVMEANRNGRFN